MRSNYLTLPEIQQKQAQKNINPLSFDKLESEQEIPFGNDEQMKVKKLQKLQETKQKIKNTVNRLKVMNENKLEKLKLKLKIADQIQLQKEEQIKRKIQKKQDMYKQRLEQEQINRLKKQQQESIKDMFNKRREKQKLESEIKNFKSQFLQQKQINTNLNKSNEKYDSQSNSNSPYSKTVGGIPIFQPPPQQLYEDQILLTQPIIYEKTPSQGQLVQQNNKRTVKPSFKSSDKQENPFNQKENWDLVFDARQKGETQVEWPGIGIKKTPIYELKQQEKEKNRKKLDLLKRINRGDFLNIKHNRINFESVYKNVKEVYKIVSDNPDQLLIDAEARKESFMDKRLEKTIKNAQSFWNGQKSKKMQYSGSLPNLDKYDEFLEEDIDQPPKKKYMFTKLTNVKVKLE